MPSESDDEDERLDCVHDIHQRKVIDQHDTAENGNENYYYTKTADDHNYPNDYQED